MFCGARRPVTLSLATVLCRDTRRLTLAAAAAVVASEPVAGGADGAVLGVGGCGDGGAAGCSARDAGGGDDGGSAGGGADGGADGRPGGGAANALSTATALPPITTATSATALREKRATRRRARRSPRRQSMIRNIGPSPERSRCERSCPTHQRDERDPIHAASRTDHDKSTTYRFPPGTTQDSPRPEPRADGERETARQQRLAS
jgi:hypothetical protein